MNTISERSIDIQRRLSSHVATRSPWIARAGAGPLVNPVRAVTVCLETWQASRAFSQNQQGKKQ
jgi:hypothetical protein